MSGRRKIHYTGIKSKRTRCAILGCPRPTYGYRICATHEQRIRDAFGPKYRK